MTNFWRRVLKEVCATLLAVTLGLSGCGGGSGGSPQGYTLSASFQGLTSAGLLLAVSGNRVSIPANSATHSLADSLASGTPYSVTVQAQPTGETCTVANGSGTMPASAVSNVAVNCFVNTFTIGGT